LPQTTKNAPEGASCIIIENDQPEADKVGLASLMRPDEAASDHVRCGISRYAVAPTQAAAIIAA
jgi:hypothetical protein